MSRPALHLLVIGVSEYPYLNGVKEDPDAGPPHFGLQPLTSAARSADQIAEWVREHTDRFGLPLGSCRVLLSPTEAELEEDHALRGMQSFDATTIPRPVSGSSDRTPWMLANLENASNAVKAWRADAEAHPDGVTMFYFAGHGLQRRHLESATDHVLLLRDFGSGKRTMFSDCISVQDIMDCMHPAPEGPQIARRQYFMFDACRSSPKALTAYERTPCSAIVDFRNRYPTDDRELLDWRTTESGAAAHAERGGLTYFAKALLECLNGGAGERDPLSALGASSWQLTVRSLEIGVTHYLSSLGSGVQRAQMRTRTMSMDTMFCRLLERPKLPIKVYVKPIDVLDAADVRFLDERNRPALQLPVPVPYPYEHPLPLGMYRYTATASAKVGESELFHHDRPGNWIEVVLR